MNTVLAAGELLPRLRYVYDNFSPEVATAVMEISLLQVGIYILRGRVYSKDDAQDVFTDRVTELNKFYAWTKTVPVLAMWLKKYGLDLARPLVRLADRRDSDAGLEVLTALLSRKQPKSKEEVLATIQAARNTHYVEQVRRPMTTGTKVADLSCGFTVWQLRTQAELAAEGNKRCMKNCIGDYYTEEGGIISGRSGQKVEIFSIRDPFGIPRVDVALNARSREEVDVKEYGNDNVGYYEDQYRCAEAEFFDEYRKGAVGGPTGQFTVTVKTSLLTERLGVEMESDDFIDVPHELWEFQNCYNGWGFGIIENEATEKTAAVDDVYLHDGNAYFCYRRRSSKVKSTLVPLTNAQVRSIEEALRFSYESGTELAKHQAVMDLIESELSDVHGVIDVDAKYDVTTVKVDRPEITMTFESKGIDSEMDDLPDEAFKASVVHGLPDCLSESRELDGGVEFADDEMTLYEYLKELEDASGLQIMDDRFRSNGAEKAAQLAAENEARRAQQGGG